MTTQAAPTPAARPRRAAPPQAGDLLVLGAPLAALLAGMGAEWLDFRALRVPFLLVAGFGVLATAYALSGTRTGVRPALTTVAVGAATWAAAESVYAVLHVALGHEFHAGRFGPQWSQALGLIAAHGLFLGVPTGVAAAIMLHAAGRRRRRAEAA